MSHLRRILASEGLLKSAGWVGDIYIGKGVDQHAAFPEFLAWAKKTAKKKWLIDNSGNAAPFDRISIKLSRQGLLDMGLSGSSWRDVYFPGESGTYPSVGGDYNIPYEMTGETRNVRVSNYFTIMEDAASEAENPSWYIRYGTSVGRRSEDEEVFSPNTRAALTKATRLLRSFRG